MDGVVPAHINAPQPRRDAGRPLTICFPFAGGAIGGSHVSAVKLITALDRTEFAPLVLLHSSSGAVADYLRSQDVDFEPAPTPEFLTPGAGGGIRRLPDMARLVMRLERFVRERQIAIVHTNDGPMHATWSMPARLAGAKLLWHHRGNPQAAGLRYLAPLLANQVVSVSSYAAPRRGVWSAARKCAVVHSPFEPRAGADQSPPAAELAALGLPPDARILGFFGNLIDRKRPLVFVEALAAVRDRDPGRPVIGLMFGDALDPGLDTAVIERARALGVSNSLHLMGFRTPPEPWLALCDILVVTAVEEPFGRTLIEAMMLGTPVVAAASGGNIEAIRHLETGVLVTPDDPAAFADAIVTMLDEPMAVTAIAARAKQEALARFSVDAHVRSISTIYRALAA